MVASRHSAKDLDGLILTKKRYGVGIAWDCIGRDEVDLDLQCVIVDNKGVIVDAVYYNNITSLGGAIASVGDNATGAAEGVDEQIWIQMDKLPKSVHMLIFVIAAYKNGHLRDAENGKILIMEQSVGHTIKSFKIEQSAVDADVVALIKRHPVDGTWTLHEVIMPATFGSHFLDILEPNIGDIIRKEIRHAPAYQKVAFVMDKGAVSDLPMNNDMKRLFIGIGGDLPADSETDVDLDISVVFLSEDGTVVGSVDADHTNLFGVSHSGDETVAGDSAMDDEAISMDLRQIPDTVSQIFIVMTCKTGDFSLVEKLYARVADNTSKEIARFHLAGGVHQNGLAIGRLFRTSGRWGFQALGKFVRGQEWQEAMPFIMQIFREPTREVVGKRQLLKQRALDSPGPEDVQKAEPQTPAAPKEAPRHTTMPERPSAVPAGQECEKPTEPIPIEAGGLARSMPNTASIVTSTSGMTETTAPAGIGCQSLSTEKKGLARKGTLKLRKKKAAWAGEMSAPPSRSCVEPANLTEAEKGGKPSLGSATIDELTYPDESEAKERICTCSRATRCTIIGLC